VGSSAGGVLQVPNPESSGGAASGADSGMGAAYGGTVDVVANGDRSLVISGADSAGRRNPQLVQNFAPSRFWAAQLGHRFM
jgi:hypothetical protein